MKYIPADKLIAEIERRLKDYWEISFHDAKAYGEDSNVHELKELLTFIASLQQEQPVDKNFLTWRDVNELERIINKVHYEFQHGIGEEAFGKLVLERFIDGKDDVQEQTEVDLDDVIENYILENFGERWDGCVPVSCFELNMMANHFYKLGRFNARKEE